MTVQLCNPSNAKHGCIIMIDDLSGSYFFETYVCLINCAEAELRYTFLISVHSALYIRIIKT